MIEFDDFLKVDLRVGTITRAELNPQAKKPAYVLEIDFGAELGLKISSAQITQNYQPEDLIGMQIIAVVNFPPKRIAGIKSEVLVLGAVDETEGVILLTPSLAAKNGLRIL